MPEINPENESEKVLLSWTAPARPFKRMPREFFIKAITIGVLFSIILFLIDGPLPVILLISLGFLVYVYFTVEPGQVQYAITNKGIKVHDKVTAWHDLGRFWFGTRLGSELLMIEAAVLGGRLELVINPQNHEQIQQTLAKYLTYQQVAPTFADKAIDWFSGKVLTK